MALRGIFSNPLIDALLVAEVGSNLVASNEAAKRAALLPDPTAVKFSQLAYRKGAEVTEMPREGLFGKLGAKMGILSPTIKATPEQLAEEDKVLMERNQAVLGMTKDLISARKTLGPGNYSRMLMNNPNIAQTAVQTGMADLGEPTPQEAATAALSGNRQATQELNKQRLEEERKRTKGYLQGVESTTAMRTFEIKSKTPGTPEFAAAQQAKVETAEAIAGGVTTKRAEAIYGSWPAWHNANKNRAYIDTNTLLPIDERKYKTPADAQAAANAGLVHDSNAEQIRLAAQARGQLDTFTKMEAMLPSLFISQAGMSPTTFKIRAAQNALKWFNNQNDPTYRLWKSYMTSALETARIMNQRFPNQIELSMVKEDAFPSLSGNFRELKVPDSLESATQLLMAIKRRAKNGTVAGFAGDTANDTNTEAGAAVDEALYGGGLSPDVAAALGAAPTPPPAMTPVGGDDTGLEGEVGRTAAGE